MMAAIGDRRKCVRYLWSSLVVFTFVACGVLVYISLILGKEYHSEAQRGRNFHGTAEKLTGDKCSPVCDSEECVHQSNFLLNQIETHADPCENFYEFACGGYVDQYWNESANVVLDMMLKLKVVLKSILENMDANPESSSGKLKKVYDSCIKQSSSDSRAIPSLLLYLTSFGIPDRPNLDSDFKFNEPSFIEVLGNFLTYQEYAFFDIKGDFEERMPYSERKLTIKASKSVYEKKSEKSTRKYLMEKVLQYFDLDSETITEIWEESEAILDAIIHLKEESRRIENEVEDEEPPLISCAQVKGTEWGPVCGILESFVDTANVGVVVSKKFVFVEDVYFLQNIFTVISNFSDKSIANYLTINLFFNHLDELNFYFRLTFQKDPDAFIPSMGFQTEIGNWHHCTEWLIENMFLPLGYVYMKEYLSEPIMKEIRDLVGECIEETAEAVSNQEWMSESIRMEYAQKTGKTTHVISNLAELTNETVLTKAYNQFHPKDSNFIYNVFEYQRFKKVDEMLGFLHEARLKLLRSEILKVGASGAAWNLNLHPGFLSHPVFYPGLQRLINLVSLTAVVAHEVGHSLHFESYIFRADKATKEHMDETLRCIANQYSRFKFESIGKNVNGSMYVSENFADNIAISIVDKVIEKYASEEVAFLLPGFPYSASQSLYISAVQIWCGSFNKINEEFNYSHGPHMLGNFRILGMMQNSKGFAKAFNCTEGSYMNPSNKCLFLE